MPKKILFVFGTRPEAIKMAPVIELAKKTKGLKPIVCVTAQHRYLLDQALAEFGIKPDIDLNLMKPKQTLYDVTSGVMKAIGKIYRKVQPDLVLLQGDTSTVFAAALAAYYENIDVGHIEAGLRSGDNRNPFPEEVNREFVSLVARFNFCPTPYAKLSLLKEGTDPKRIFVTGNTVIDALKGVLKKVRRNAPDVTGVNKTFLEIPYALITGHRRENFNGGMKNICLTIKSLAKKHPDFRWLWAAHLNPNARGVVFRTLSGLKNVKLIEPPPYKEFVHLMDRSKFIISDSGGVQEEAPFLKKKVFVTRICTERPEAVRAGTSILVGTDPRKINKHVNKALKAKSSSGRFAKNPFGDGMAAKRIVDVIRKGKCKEFK
ncbi:MAG: UDP-N-acetylglucosamine 2-epimerase (non-hydrolyzing) [Candidatus Omnitrophica bacterium]|nr:UDP-N-acetylglucosamine 2-epimerase (non-hydrolyzing) [Candidatus Omnitrophota bacterium]